MRHNPLLLLVAVVDVAVDVVIFLGIPRRVNDGWVLGWTDACWYMSSLP